jgi:hypothetical protein
MVVDDSPNMFNRKRSREIEDFAVSLARDILSRCPVAEALEGDHISMRLARAIDEACTRAAAYQREQRLWVYGKAKLGTAFKLELKEIGYPEAFVDSLTRQLLFKMSA